MPERAKTPQALAPKLGLVSVVLFGVVWFGVLTRQSIRRGTFSSVNVLIKQIRDYISSWNENAKPFTWTATAGEVLAKVRLVQTNMKKLVRNNSQ